MTDLRIGHGYDVHRLVEGRKLILGGVDIPHTVGLLGHSDADVLTHAIMDAVVGALGLGDIGKHFPDTDPSFKDADSLRLAEHICSIMETQGFVVGNIDATVIAQAPKLASYIQQMRENLAQVWHTTPDRVNIKATTEENLGFTGSKEGMSAHAVCVIFKH